MVLRAEMERASIAAEAEEALLMARITDLELTQKQLFEENTRCLDPHPHPLLALSFSLLFVCTVLYNTVNTNNEVIKSSLKCSGELLDTTYSPSHLRICALPHHVESYSSVQIARELNGTSHG